MAIQTYTNLRTRAQEIKNEVTEAANTALRVGGLMEDKVDTIESGFSTVLPANPDQIINTGDGFATIASVYRRPDNSIIDFRTSGQRLDDTNPVYDTFTIPDTYLLKTNLLNKWDILFSCLSVPAIISSPPTWLTVTGDILTGYANLNRITFELDQVYNATDDIFELKVICNITQAEGANADPNAPSGQLFPDILLRLDFEDTMDPVPLELLDSGTNLDVDLTNEAGDLSSVLGVDGQGIKRGVLNSQSGARLTVPYTVQMGNITQNSGFYLGVFLKLSSENTTNKVVRLFSSNGSWASKGVRISGLSNNSIEFYIKPEFNGDTARRLITNIPNGFLFDDAWHFYSYRYNETSRVAQIYRDNVLMTSGVFQNVDETPENISSDFDWQIFHTSTGAMCICEADALIVASRNVSDAEMLSHYDLRL